MPYKGGVQLLPETQRRPTLASYTSGNGYFYFGVVVALFVVIASAVLSSYKANLNDQVAKLDGQLQATETARNKTQEAVLIAAAKQSSLMRQLLASKIYWSQALTAMERMAQSSVNLDSLDASFSKGTITIHGTADSYATVARQFAAFVAGTGIQDIELRSVKSTPQGSVEFDGNLFIDTKVMLTKAISK
jgi:hypothetical protein